MNNIEKGKTLDSGFKILDVIDLQELRAAGIWAKHEKTGVEVFHVLNDDSENLFCFGFATFPQDNTGAAHILEHTVLCGSERYPLKDAFLVLAQGSLQTFLNAITFPDKTVYPASSTNEHDYFNLMSVYGDAVFHPLLSQWSFMQEGHRKEFNKEGKLSITGVVYNEMKGAYSSLDAYAARWSVESVMPGTPYAFESGGDPDEIPKLDWEGLKEFHRSRYSPANCRIFLAGNIPTEKQLAFLSEKFFSGMEGGEACAPIKKAERWDTPKKMHIPCPAGGESKPTVFLSWLCSDVTDTYEGIALAALTEILLGHDGSPLTRALVESGLGEDITPVSGLEGEIRETLFVAGLKSVNGDVKEAGGKVERLILNELKRLVSEGIPEEEIEAALLLMEFSQREIKRVNGPYSLVWMRRSLRGWLHGCKPWESLLFNPAIKKIKENISADKRYFERLIQKYLLDNQHRALVIIEPKEEFLPEQEARLAKELADEEKHLSAGEKQGIIDKSAELEKMQSEADSVEALAAIPHLSRKDLSVEHEIIPRFVLDLQGVPTLTHDLFTNGISYYIIAFPVDTLPFEDYHWLPFFSRSAVSVGLPGMDYGEVSSLFARNTGGFNAALHSCPSAQSSPQNIITPSGSIDIIGRDWITYRLKCLDEKIAPSLDLALRMIREADFSDHRRINDLVLEMKSEMDSSLAPAGHMYAGGRSARRNSRSKQIEEIWHGISQIDFIHKLSKMDTAEIAEKLFCLREKLADGGVIVNITGNAIDAACSELSKRFSCFGVPKPRNYHNLPSDENISEVYASASLQVGFAAQTFNSAPYDTREQIAEIVMAHQMSMGALWEDIRMKGGAYGAFVSSYSLENSFTFATYRDPSPQRSLDIFKNIMNNGRPEDCSEDFLVKSIIGCYSKETTPRTSAEKGNVDFLRFLSGIEDDQRKRRLERMVSITAEDINNAYKSLLSKELSGQVIISGVKTAEQAAKTLGVGLKMLPI